MKRKIILLLVGLLVVFGYVFNLQKQYKNFPITRGAMRLTVAASGAVHAESEANLRFGSTGRISSLPFKENDQVKKGQAVASLDTSDLQAIQQRELLNYEDARTALDHQRDEYNDNNTIVNDTEKHLLQSKQNTVDRSVINVEIADRAAKNASLYSPFDGVVVAVNGQVNEWTNALSTQPLVSIVDFNTLYFEADVNQENSEGIQPGQSVVITFDAHKQMIHHGVVTEVSPLVKTTIDGDKVIPVKIKITDPGNNIKLHLDGDAQITIGEKRNILLLPKKAVEQDEKGAFVFIGNSLSKQKKRVKLGAFDGTNWEVTQGLKENENVLIKNEL